MVYEEVILKPGNTISQVSNNYGYNLWDWKKIWAHQGNAHLKELRGKPEHVLAGDKIIIPLPWKITSKTLTAYNKGNGKSTFAIRAKRNGTKGKNLRWVQTVFQDNQPIGTTATFCADACPGDDDDPFYYTTSELVANSGQRNTFFDAPWRNPSPNRTTTWRAVLSLCSVEGLRVSIFESIVWGINFGKNGINTDYMPRPATPYEVAGHLRLLKIGKGQTRSFRAGGWTFRKAPNVY